MAAGIVTGVALGGLAVAAPAAGASQGPARSAATAHADTGTLRGTWRLLPKAPIAELPPAFTLSSVWASTRMIIHTFTITEPVTGKTFSYEPAANGWMRLPGGPRSWLGQGDDAAVWTGRQMLVFGLTAGAYTPSTNQWRPIKHPALPPSQITGWTGSKAVVWDQICCGTTVNTAEIYDVRANTWHTTQSPLERRSGAMGAWTGRELVIAGGFSGFPSGGKVFRDGAAYNPATGTWRKLPPMPQRRGGGTAVWDGKDVVFLGGTAPGSSQPSLRPMAYNPRANRWRLLPVMQFRREGFAAVWTGRYILVWGGVSGRPGAWMIPPHGEAYNPATSRWTALPASPLQGREMAAAVWTGKRMIIWGGYAPGRSGTAGYVNGAAFTPRTP
ncbi:MAG TPA: hypothetical protein VF314_07660 [Actinomycetes bacterium]